MRLHREERKRVREERLRERVIEIERDGARKREERLGEKVRENEKEKHSRAYWIRKEKWL